MAVFRGAVEAGSHALETDLHLSKDGVVMLSEVRDPVSILYSISMIYLSLTSQLISGCHTQSLFRK